jgi:hypothetical protein
LSLLDVAVAIAEVDGNIMDSRDVDDDELLVCPHGSGAALVRGMPQLNNESQILERTPNKKSPIPFLKSKVSFASRNDRGLPY